MERYDIPCECGRGFKEFLRATEKSQNLGRFFYKCGYNGRRCVFVWADELLTSKWAHLHRYIKRTSPEGPAMYPDECQTSNLRERSRHQSYRMEESRQNEATKSEVATSPFSGNVNLCNPFPAPLGSSVPVGVLCCLFGTAAVFISFLVLIICIVMVKN